MAAAGLTPEQAAIVALQGELQTTKDMVTQVSHNCAQLHTDHQALRRAHEALNTAADSQLGQRALEIQATESRLKDLLFRQKFDLLESKDLRPDTFKGRATEPFKPWQKRLKAYCNSKAQGFKKALDWAEKEQG